MTTVLTLALKNFLALNNIGPTQFADEILCERATISHLLSGRNKLSFETLKKIYRIKRFRELAKLIFYSCDAEDKNYTAISSLKVGPKKVVKKKDLA